MTSSQDNKTENSSVNSEASSSDTIETNAEPEAVAVKAVSSKEKEKVGEDEEVEHSPLKDGVPTSADRIG